MDPHEKVNMDAEKIMSNTWDFEFIVKKTLKKTCSRNEIPYHTPAQDPGPQSRALDFRGETPKAPGPRILDIYRCII